VEFTSVADRIGKAVLGLLLAGLGLVCLGFVCVTCVEVFGP
jgi:hypothetical protein